MREKIRQVIADEPVALIMKGTPQRVMCGNSTRALEALRRAGAPVTAVDILPDAQIRQELSALSGWPTIPQIFIRGQLIGGADTRRSWRSPASSRRSSSRRSAQATAAAAPRRPPRSSSGNGRPRRRRARRTQRARPSHSHRTPRPGRRRARARALLLAIPIAACSRRSSTRWRATSTPPKR
jgi:Grx4 family monothiol glutaredoxin